MELFLPLFKFLLLKNLRYVIYKNEVTHYNILNRIIKNQLT